MPEVLLQVAAQVIGNDAAITIGGQAGNFELNTMLRLSLQSAAVNRDTCLFGDSVC